ncbi:MAG: PilZ domain-containing protein [Clostridia bacterium]|nr:PilZ domain-containing protein [Clostridia bacterium]
MNFNIGDAVFVRHYSDQNPIRSVIRSIQGENLSLKLTMNFASNNFYEGDPVVIGYERDGEVFLVSGNLTEVSLRQGIISLKADKSEQISDKRKYERFFVSLHADVRPKGARNNSVAVIKNISFNGMMFTTKSDFRIEQELEFDVNIGNRLIFLNSEVIWKVNHQQHSEYGVEIKYKNQRASDQVKQYLQQLTDEQQSFIKQLRELI